MEIYGISDKGQKRENNEDSFIVNVNGGYAIVADGMGGHLGGEVASSMCTKLLSELIEIQCRPFSDIKLIEDILKSSVAQINDQIYRRSMEDKSLLGMGTTLTFLMEFDKNVVFLNVGDSRIYLIRNREITQLTRDDSLVAELVENGEITKAEMRFHPLKHRITKSIGTKSVVPFSVETLEYRKGDCFIMCSDGLSDMLDDREIMDIGNSNIKPKQICRNLIKKANEYGGRDNITVVVWKF